ncbi:DUF3800 domain-containing protein [Streptomyces sp. NBC_00347]|uniref:DUF3800 domain-containing protein n=1 Tax=Streptomyces sp. NBC_00347 TaxID=2975721 RepID=UPI0022599F22|nr:DUF3800 domain-containing protein [Streptomyces sp. NBC_00347]MCX5130017.1 DUF3800 domain-containing protein [Streptomyces sp. NBC_00347]
MSTSSSERPVVYVDESANSGQNLLDPHQPVFTVAGVHLPADLAASIVDEVRGQLPSNLREPKYTSLAGSSRGRKSLMNAFSRLPKGSVQTYLVHKRFMVMTKMVDVIVEPMAHRDGYNLYEGKESLALADLLHLGGPVLGDADAYDRMLHAFVDWVRQKATTDELYAAVAALKSSVRDRRFAEWVEVLEYCRPVADETAAEVASEGHRDELDPAIPSLYCLATTFGQTLGKFRLVYDASKVVDRNTTRLHTVHLFPDPARPGEFMNPLMGAIEFADSKDHPQLQVADWAAGATRQWAQQMAAGTSSRVSWSRLHGPGSSAAYGRHPSRAEGHDGGEGVAEPRCMAHLAALAPSRNRGASHKPVIAHPESHTNSTCHAALSRPLSRARPGSCHVASDLHRDYEPSPLFWT